MSQELLWAKLQPCGGGRAGGGPLEEEVCTCTVVTALDREGKPGAVPEHLSAEVAPESEEAMGTHPRFTATSGLGGLG